MTREEAIAFFEDMNECTYGNLEAVEMAISALSTEGEYIKKDDAISKILTEFVAREENRKVMCACADVKQTCADILDSLPSYSFPNSAEELSEDGTLTVHVSDGSKVKRVLVMGENIFGGLYYPDSENKGEWIYDKNINNWRCSKCGQAPPPTGYVGKADFMATHFKFCPDCGADMRGE